MICPYCKKEMKEGYFFVGLQPVYWIPKEEDHTWLINHATGNKVLLAKYNPLKVHKIKVFRCPHCQIEIIDEKNKSFLK